MSPANVLETSPNLYRVVDQILEFFKNTHLGFNDNDLSFQEFTYITECGMA